MLYAIPQKTTQQWHVSQQLLSFFTQSIIPENLPHIVPEKFDGFIVYVKWIGAKCDDIWWQEERWISCWWWLVPTKLLFQAYDDEAEYDDLQKE